VRSNNGRAIKASGTRKQQVSEIEGEIGGGVTENSRVVHRRMFCELWSCGVCLLVIVISGLLRVHQFIKRHPPALRHSAVEGTA
jgi:hypothetical protein